MNQKNIYYALGGNMIKLLMQTLGIFLFKQGFVDATNKYQDRLHKYDEHND